MQETGGSPAPTTFPPSLPRIINLGVEDPKVERQTFKPAAGLAPYADGSKVVEVIDHQLGVTVLVRMYLDGSFVPL